MDGRGGRWSTVGLDANVDTATKCAKHEPLNGQTHAGCEVSTGGDDGCECACACARVGCACACARVCGDVFECVLGGCACARARVKE
jgi:hypothetical protein